MDIIYDLIDISIVTYNSERWVQPFFESLNCQMYPLSCLNIKIVDNGSTDDTIKLLKTIQNQQLNRFASFQIIQGTNCGYGAGHNINIKSSKVSWLLVTNIDLEFESDSIEKAHKIAVEDEQEVASWEFRQKPYEHPKDYDPLTLETSWSSHACILFRVSALKVAGGYEEKIFMYGEDVELSFRLRSLGYKLKYCPSAVCWHYSYEDIKQPKANQILGSVESNFYIRIRYGHWLDILKWCFVYIGLFILSRKYGLKKIDILALLNKTLSNYGYFKKNRKRSNFKIKFIRLTYSLNRDGYDYEYCRGMKETPLVSIITRTYSGRQCLLEQVYQSLLNQTYKNYEWIIIEDGSTENDKLVKQFSKLLVVKYIPIEKKGRTYAGNQGLKYASGEYCIFLDDDDLFYPDHLEVLVNEIEQSSNIGAVYSTAFEVPSSIENTNPLKIQEGSKAVIYRKKFSRLLLRRSNYISIQSILFRKVLFDNYGGFNERLECLEDWNLWLRYSFYTEFRLVSKTTSLYRVPLDAKTRILRQKKIDAYFKTFCIIQRELEQVIGINDLETNTVDEKYGWQLLKKIVKQMRNIPIFHHIYYKLRSIYFNSRD